MLIANNGCGGGRPEGTSKSRWPHERGGGRAEAESILRTADWVAVRDGLGDMEHLVRAVEEAKRTDKVIFGTPLGYDDEDTRLQGSNS